MSEKKLNHCGDEKCSCKHGKLCCNGKGHGEVIYAFQESGEFSFDFNEFEETSFAKSIAESKVPRKLNGSIIFTNQEIGEREIVLD